MCLDELDTLSLDQAIVDSHVNLVDLTDSDKEKRVRRHPTEEALARYTRDTEKYFPRKTAYHTGLLRYLLRQIKGEYKGHRNKIAQRRPRSKGKRKAAK